MPLIPFEPRRTCRLDTGHIVFYDACSELQSDYDLALFECLGRGVIHEIDGIADDTGKQLYFFVRRGQHVD